jgi:hypothetical protein
MKRTQTGRNHFERPNLVAREVLQEAGIHGERLPEACFADRTNADRHILTRRPVMDEFVCNVLDEIHRHLGMASERSRFRIHGHGEKDPMGSHGHVIGNWELGFKLHL